MATRMELAAARRFTRMFAREIELLDEHYLRSRFTLAEGRVIYELAQRGGSTSADLARDLGLDPGYLSRIVKRLAGEGLLARSPSPSDARQSDLALTEAGRAAFAELDAASDAGWAARLDRLARPERDRMRDAMRTIERCLHPDPAAPGPEVRLRRHQVGDLGWIAHRQGVLYGQEYGFDATFEALVAEIMASFVKDHDPARERAWIADRDSEVLGSVFLVRETDETAKLRLLYVEPAARGLGLGRRLVEACIAGAPEAGYRRLVLWTNDCLTAARAIYVKAGFERTAEERHRSFGVDLVGQHWALDLRAAP